MLEQRIPCDMNNRVIIRIWTSKSNKDYPGQNVGHISIETTVPKSYMSLWPVPFTPLQIETYRQAGTLEQKILKYFGERDSHYMAKYEDDYKAEGNHPPQLVICLYDLNAENIKNTFDELKTSITSWRLIGSNLFVQKLEDLMALPQSSKTFESTIGKTDTDNCGSFAYKLLKAGGIYDKISSSFSFKFSSIVTPDDLATAVLSAKKYELQHYPETKGFTFEGETKVETKNTMNCLIM